MKLNESVVKKLINRRLTIATMESCTAGAFIGAITDIEGSSTVTDGGYVTYSNKSKIANGVPSTIIDEYGVYSGQTAKAMARRCMQLNEASIGIGVTGTLSNVDPVNNDSTPGTVFYCITYLERDHTIKLTVPIMERPMQKQFIVENILKTLLELLD